MSARGFRHLNRTLVISMHIRGVHSNRATRILQSGQRVLREGGALVIQTP